MSSGAETFTARAHAAQEPERTRLYNDRVAAMPRFAEYKAMTERLIPVIVVERL